MRGPLLKGHFHLVWIIIVRPNEALQVPPRELSKVANSSSISRQFASIMQVSAEDIKSTEFSKFYVQDHKIN